MDHLHTSAPRAGRRPRWLAALVAVVAALFLAGGLAAPAQAAAATTTLTVSASDYSVSSGASVTVTGTLKRGSKAVSGVYVTLQKRTAGSSKWTTVKKAKTSSKGKVSAKVSGLTKNTEIRAVFSGTSKYKASKSSTKKVTVTQKVSIGSTSTTKPTKGGTIWLKGTTTSGLAGRTVQLQKKSGSSWTKVASATVSTKNGFYLTTTAGSAGKAAYRVYAPATASTKSATSAEKAFTVHEWFALDSIPSLYVNEVDLGQRLTNHDFAVNGQTFRNNLTGTIRSSDGEDAFFYDEWDLGGKCLTFTATAGIDDTQVSGNPTAGFLAGSDVDGYMSELNVSEYEKVSVSLKDSQSFGLFLAYAGTEDDGSAALAGFGDPKILCSSKPAA